MLSNDSFFSSIKRYLSTPSASILQILALSLVPFLTMIYHHRQMEQMDLAMSSMQQMQERLTNLTAYDLRSLQSKGDRLALLQKITLKEGQALKFTSEAAVEDRRVRERPLVMQQSLVIESSALLKILDILQAPTSDQPTPDFWIKKLKVRKERAGFVFQLSLLKRELKS